jgi:uncharacterized cofD-like protein
MIAMTDITGSEIAAIDAFKYLFEVRADIFPVTLDDAKLVAKYEDGTEVRGEHLIDEPQEPKKIEEISLSSETKAYEGAVEAIQNSDFIVLGPGDLYTTTLATLIVPGISEALQETKAKLIFIPNLMSKIGQTRGLTQKDMVELIEKYIGRKVDYVLVNNGKLPQKALERYLEDGEHVFKDDLGENGRDIVRTDLVANSVIKKDKGDELVRSLIRHDPEKLGSELYNIFKSNKWNRVWSWILNLYR